MTPNVLSIGETITKLDGSQWVSVDVAVDWRDPASEMVVSVSAIIPVRLDQGQLETEVKALAIEKFLSTLQSIISNPSSSR